MPPALDPVKLQAWWWRKQGFGGVLEGADSARVLAQTGWARSVGGVGPYLTLYSRAGITREQADAALAAREIHELPAARGCTYVVPAADYPLALRAGRGGGADAEMQSARRAGVTDEEVKALCAKVLEVLRAGALEPAAIRAAAGAAVRSLGDAGKKVGITTTLPVALGLLQQTGEIRRIPTNGRLDQERYAYALWEPNPLADSSQTVEEVQVELARRYLGWTGSASLAEFQWFSGLGVKAAKAAMAALNPVEIGDGRMMLAGEADLFVRFKAPGKPEIALVSSVDGLLLLRRNIGSVAGGDVAAVRGLKDLPSHAIFDRGRLSGCGSTIRIRQRSPGRRSACPRRR